MNGNEKTMVPSASFQFPEVVAGLDPLACDWTLARGRGYP